MKYLLDSNTCIEFLRLRDSAVKRNMAGASWDDIVLCSVVKAELYYGAHRSAHADANLKNMREFFQSFESLPFDDSAAEVYGRIRTLLQKQGNLIGPNDLLIASVALANNVILITHNTGEFSRVPGLQMEDWQV